ncbi:MAG: hypothetical protein AVDCRST_MAG45-1066, partial [uncultured Solirubrobacterales bacterium]
AAAARVRAGRRFAPPRRPQVHGARLRRHDRHDGARERPAGLHLQSRRLRRDRRPGGRRRTRAGGL